jgi:TetR/AcrR family transcriptional regulator
MGRCAREKVVARDPEQTRRRILAAAEREFSAKGFAGARVDAIAKRARVNKRMLYHYFGNKQGLFREILLRKMTNADSPFRVPEELAGGLAEHLLHFDKANFENLDFVRLLEWEALEGGGRQVTGEDERVEAEKRGVAMMRAAQSAGLTPSDLDPAQLLMALMGIVIFPQAFPQMARIVTGLLPTDPEFRRQRVEFLTQLAGHLSVGLDA